ncbi:hypothetical protein KKC31_00905 [Patescibacteria group bacterium]|nr:hypothetical protein [Patescibacteria group bacterium]
MKKTLGVFTAGLAWFAFLIPWNGFADPDAFYHAKAALLVWQNGPMESFPWLDLTALGTSFADQHFLFHLIEAPFVAVFGWADGARSANVFLAAVFLAVFYACLKSLGANRAGIWTLLLALTPPLIMRILLGKATPLALALFIFGITAAWKRKPLWVFVAAALFALSHGGWAFLLGALVMILIGDLLFNRIVEGLPRRESIFLCFWKELAAALLGALAGTLAHPNFPDNLRFLWMQVVKIGLLTPFNHVILGSEWLPSKIGSMLIGFGLWLCLLFLAGAGLLFAAKQPPDKKILRPAAVFAWPTAAFLALSFKSRRNVEYLAPIAAIWLAWLWSAIDIKKLLQVLFDQRKKWKAAVAVCSLLMVIISLRYTYILLHKDLYPDAVFSTAMQAVSLRAQEGDRVFHSDWDEFPMLFNLDDRLRYVAGLDPTFLYEASSSLSDAYRDVTWGKTTTTKEQAWELIHDRLKARFVFIAKSDHQPLLDLIKSDERYKLLAETEDSATFELMDEK